MLINHVFENLTLCITDGHYQNNIDNLINVPILFDIDNLIGTQFYILYIYN